MARRKILAGEMFASMPLGLAMTSDIAKADSPTPVSDEVSATMRRIGKG